MIRKNLKFMQTFNIEKMAENYYQLSIIEDKQTEGFGKNKDFYEPMSKAYLHLSKEELKDLNQKISDLIQEN